MSKHNILLVDDEHESLSSTESLLRRWGHEVTAVSNGVDAVDLIRTMDKEFSVAVLDYQMKDQAMSGGDIALQIRNINDEISLLMYSAHPSVESLKATLRTGGLNFIEKSENVNSLREAVEKACREYEKVRTVKPPLSDSDVASLIKSVGMAGRSLKLAKVAELIIKFRASRKSVLILGETGVGKEKVATALHTGSPESFFVVNCAAFQQNGLIESELFGHEKGAFTGAITRKVGILEAARGGTVYLDEVQHLDMVSQGKLLRAIREKKIRRVGGIREEPVQFRLIVSAWPDLEQRVEDGTFSRDLYYRFKFLTINVPPLRERKEDIEPLVLNFCDKYFDDTGTRKTFLKGTMRMLESYDWPGNVGELDGYVSALLEDSSRATVDHSKIDPELRLDSGQGALATIAQIDARTDSEKRRVIRYALSISNSDRHAARLLGIKLSSLQRLMASLGINEPSPVSQV